MDFVKATVQQGKENEWQVTPSFRVGRMNDVMVRVATFCIWDPRRSLVDRKYDLQELSSTRSFRGCTLSGRKVVR